MKKTIPVEKLKIGMIVVGMDKSWFETSFLTHTFIIRSPKDIEKLKKNGVQSVVVEIKETTEGSKEEGTSEEGGDQESVPSDRLVPSLKELPENASDPVQIARSLREETIHLLQRSFRQVRIQGIVSTTEIRSRVRGAIDFLLHNRNAVALLSEIHDNDDETYVHSANTMFLAAGFSIRHKMSEAECLNWGLAALLHDVGKTRIPEQILKKPGPLDFAEWKVMHQHPIHGFQILRKSPDPDIHGLCAQVAVEHHERKNGTGYPHRIGLDEVHPVSRSLMVLDIYEALTADRVYHSRSSPQKVIHYLVEEYSDRVSVPVILELAAMTGIFPVGTFVEIGDEEIWMVLEYEDNSNYQGSVKVLKLFGPGRKRLLKPETVTIPFLDQESVIRTYDYLTLGFTSEHWEFLLKGSREIT